MSTSEAAGFMLANAVWSCPTWVLFNDVGNATLKRTKRFPYLKDCLWKGSPLPITVLMSSGLMTSPGLFWILILEPSRWVI